MTAPTPARVRAPAKVNLHLRILGRRPDGFHDLETLFQAVDLCDEVTLTPGPPGVRLAVEGPDLGPLEENLAYRAAQGFLSAAGLSGDVGVSIRLRKVIPAGAGLGGGSSDAGAVLRGMRALWPGRADGSAVDALATGLGSDVPFFLGESGLAVGTGRGEVLEPRPPLPTGHLVLVLPPVHVATGGAYAALARAREGGPPPEPAGWRWEAPTWADVVARAANDFQSVIAPVHAEVADSLTALEAAGARPALLSGSGAACFGVFTGEGEARAAAARVSAELSWPALAVRTLERLPAVDVG